MGFVLSIPHNKTTATDVTNGNATIRILDFSSIDFFSLCHIWTSVKCQEI